MLDIILGDSVMYYVVYYAIYYVGDYVRYSVGEYVINYVDASVRDSVGVLGIVLNSMLTILLRDYVRYYVW